jgi:hypothetical protein
VEEVELADEEVGQQLQQQGSGVSVTQQ